jgi:hypothetical protein
MKVEINKEFADKVNDYKERLKQIRHELMKCRVQESAIRGEMQNYVNKYAAENAEFKIGTMVMIENGKNIGTTDRPYYQDLKGVVHKIIGYVEDGKLGYDYYVAEWKDGKADASKVHNRAFKASQLIRAK